MTNEIIKLVKAYRRNMNKWMREPEQYRQIICESSEELAQALLELYEENELLKVVDLYYDMAMTEKKELKEENEIMKRFFIELGGCERGREDDIVHLREMLMLAFNGWIKANKKLESDLKICVEVLKKVRSKCVCGGLPLSGYWPGGAVADIALKKISSNNLV